MRNRLGRRSLGSVRAGGVRARVDGHAPERRRAGGGARCPSPRRKPGRRDAAGRRGGAEGAARTLVGAAAESDVLLARGGDAFVGVWVDVPRERARITGPRWIWRSWWTRRVDGGREDPGRARLGRTIVERLADGDIISVDSFSDHARTLVAPVRLRAETRAHVLSSSRSSARAGRPTCSRVWSSRRCTSRRLPPTTPCVGSSSSRTGRRTSARLRPRRWGSSRSGASRSARR